MLGGRCCRTAMQTRTATAYVRQDLALLRSQASWGRIGKQRGVSEGKVRELIKIGAPWIDCVLELMREAA